MAYSPIRPLPPKDFSVRALRPLDPSKRCDCASAKRRGLHRSIESSAEQAAWHHILSQF